MEVNLDIEGWLRGMGLAQYVDLFRANDINGQLLVRLTGDDLKEIGIASLGHRKMLMEAIAAISAEPEAPAPTPVSATRAAERRRLTVMFVDLVGSTALSTLVIGRRGLRGHVDLASGDECGSRARHSRRSPAEEVC